MEFPVRLCLGLWWPHPRGPSLAGGVGVTQTLLFAFYLEEVVLCICSCRFRVFVGSGEFWVFLRWCLPNARDSAGGFQSEFRPRGLHGVNTHQLFLMSRCFVDHRRRNFREEYQSSLISCLHVKGQVDVRSL